MKKIEVFSGIQKNVVLAPLTTFHMGGAADYFYEAHDIASIPDLIRACQADGLPFFILASGSNVLFSDRGFRGLIIQNRARNVEVGEAVPECGEAGQPGYGPAGQMLIADSGALLSVVIQTALKAGLTGMEKMMGIPGTIGGAVRGNAGAFGTEIKSMFEKALIYRPSTDEQVEVSWEYMKFAYRHSHLKTNDEILLRIYLRLVPGDTSVGLAQIKEIMASRAGRHPHGYSAGSFFKNPSKNSVGEGVSAGQVIDQCGFKGRKIGGAFISDQHANFLMNDGQATLLNVMELYTEIQQSVKAKFGFQLEREVVLVGENGLIQDKLE